MHNFLIEYKDDELNAYEYYSILMTKMLQVSLGRSVRGTLPHRAMRASGDALCHLLAKHHVLRACLPRMTPCRSLLLTPTEWSRELSSKGSWGACIPTGIAAFLTCAFTVHYPQGAEARP